MAAPIDEATVRHIARLARLRLSEEQVRVFTRQLASIIGYVRQLDAVDTAGVEPLAHPLPITNVLREDVPRPGLTPERALAAAPDRTDNLFRVPAVLEGGGGA